MHRLQACLMTLAAWLQMTAVMGGSGSGKTTLLDILAGRKTTGQTQGDVRFGGMVASPAFLRRHTVRHAGCMLWGAHGELRTCCVIAACSAATFLPDARVCCLNAFRALCQC